MYEHENEKLVVLLASNGSIADPEHKDEFKRSVNDWDEVLRAFGSAAEPAVAVADASQATAIIPNLLLRLKAEKVSSNREKYISKVLNENSGLQCSCADVIDLLQALRYDHEKVVVFKRFIPLVTDPANRNTVCHPSIHIPKPPASPSPLPSPHQPSAPPPHSDPANCSPIDAGRARAPLPFGRPQTLWPRRRCRQRHGLKAQASWVCILF